MLVNNHYIQWLNNNAGMWFSDVSGYHAPDFSKAPPEGWQKVWHNDHAVLYKVPFEENLCNPSDVPALTERRIRQLQQIINGNEETR